MMKKKSKSAKNEDKEGRGEVQKKVDDNPDDVQESSVPSTKGEEVKVIPKNRQSGKKKKGSSKTIPLTKTNEKGKAQAIDKGLY
jgi:hypothetical protein